MSQPARSPTTAERLIRGKERILEKWEAVVRAELPAARKQDRLALLDSLPKVIDELATTLAHPDRERALRQKEKALAKEHGEERAELEGYTPDQVVIEYQVLRRAIFEELERDGPLDTRDRDFIWDTIVLAIRNALLWFVEKREQKVKKKHARSLAEAEVRHELLVEAVKDYAIFTLDTHGHIMTWNPGCTRIKQYTADETLGRHYEMLYPPEGRRRNEPMDHLKSALIEGRFRGEGMRLKKDGSLFLADVTITPIYLDGKHVGFGKVVQNLDERNRLVQERDISRVQAQALQLESELRERFVFTLSHDLRNPISAAKTSVQMIARQPCTNDKHRELSNRAIGSLDRVDRMITNLLDASRIRAGESMPLTIEECDLREEIISVVEELSTIYGDRFKIEDGESVVGFWDCGGLRRVISNLAVNAVKYGDPLKPVTIRLRPVEDRVHLSVHNFGNPITPADQEALFQPFHRTKSADQSQRSGWGLGLTLVRGIAEAHGGVVIVQSYPIEGTTFIVDLPRDARAVRAKD